MSGYNDLYSHCIQCLDIDVECLFSTDVIHSKSDGISDFCRNPKSVGYLKSDSVRLKFFVSVELNNYLLKVTETKIYHR